MDRASTKRASIKNEWLLVVFVWVDMFGLNEERPLGASFVRVLFDSLLAGRSLLHFPEFARSKVRVAMRSFTRACKSRLQALSCPILDFQLKRVYSNRTLRAVLWAALWTSGWRVLSRKRPHQKRKKFIGTTCRKRSYSWHGHTSSSSAFPAISLRFTIWGEIFASVTDFFKSNHWGSHIPSSWMVHAGCFFVCLFVFVCLLTAFTRQEHECQDLLSPCDGLHVCTDYTSVYTLIPKSFVGM